MLTTVTSALLFLPQMSCIGSFGLMNSKNMQDHCQIAEPRLSQSETQSGFWFPQNITYKLRNQILKYLRFALVKCKAQYKYDDWVKLNAIQTQNRKAQRCTGSHSGQFSISPHLTRASISPDNAKAKHKASCFSYTLP